MPVPDDLFKKIVETALAGVWVIDKDDRTTYVNAALAGMLGYTPDEMLGASIFDFRRPEDRPASAGSVERPKNGIPETKESKILCKDGTYLPVLVATNPLTGAGGEYAGAVAFVNDISERKRAELELQRTKNELEGRVGERTRDIETVMTVLRKSEERYRALLDSAPVIIAMLDREGTILFINRVSASNTLEETVGGSVFDRIPADQHGALREVLERVFAKGEPVDYRSRVLSPDGRIRWFENRVSPMRRGGTVSAAIYVSTEITDRLDDERERTMLAGMVDAAPVSITVHDFDGNFLYVNESTLSMHGYSKEEFLALPLQELDAPESAALIEGRMNEIREKGEAVFEVRHRRKDKTAFPLLVHVKLLQWEGRQVQLSMATDISDIERSNEALLERNRALAAASAFAGELAAIPPGSDIRQSIVRRFRELAGASAAWFCDFDRAAMELAVTNMELEPRLAKKAEKLLGVAVTSLRFPVSENMHAEILRPAVGRRATLQEVTFGAVPERAASAIQRILGADRFIGIAFVLEGDLFGTLVLAMSPGVPEPPEDTLVMMARMAAVSLRRQKSENALRESEERFRTAFEQGPLGMAVSDMAYRFLGANPMFCNILGYSATELARLTFSDITHADHLARDIDGMKKLDSGEMPVYRTEKRYIRKDGSEVWGRLAVSLLHDAGGRAIHHLVMLEDITARKRLEDAIAESEERYRSLVENTTEGILLTAPDGRIFSANPAACRMLGRSEEEICRLGRSGVVDTGDSRLGPALQERARTGRFRGELNFVRGDGSGFPAEISSAIFEVPAGEKRTVMIIRDLTERKRAEDALKESEAKYRELFENAQIGIYRSRIDGSTIIDVNQKLADMLGFALQELVGASAVDRWADPAERARAIMLMNERGGSVEDFEFRALKKDGTVLDALGSMHVTRDGVVEGTLVDVTERKRAETELVRLSAAVRLAHEIIIITDKAGKVTFANEAAAAALSLGRDMIAGSVFSDLLAPEDIEKGRLVLAEALKKGALSGVELSLRRRDGEPVPVELSAAALGDTAEGPAGLVTISRDVTDKRRTERELRSQLMSYELEDGNIYLVREAAPSQSLDAFRDLQRAGYRGVALSRTPPGRFQFEPGRTVDVRWMAEKGGGNALPPRVADIERWLEGLPRNRAILLDRLDYLVSKNGFKATLHFFHRLGELAFLMGHVVIVSIDSGTIADRDLRALEKEARQVVPRARPDLPRDELDVLRFVHEQGIAGTRPTLTGIGAALGLSKPTARKRVRDLVRWGHLSMSPRGRTKVLELTEQGRRIFSR